MRLLIIVALFLSGTEGAAASPDPAVLHANKSGGRIYSESYVGAGDERIHYVETGTGPTVILVHGFPSFWYVWRRQMDAFGACRRMIAIDVPGANLSGRPPRDSAYRIDRLARRLDKVITQLAPHEKVTLVGHDWGGTLAWSYAQWRSQRLDRLAVLSAPPYDLFLRMLADDPEQRAASAYMPRLVTLDRASIEARKVPSSLFATAYGHAIDSGALTSAEAELFRFALSNPAAIDAGIAWYRANIPPFDKAAGKRGWPRARIPGAFPVLLIEGRRDDLFAPTLASRAGEDLSNFVSVKLDGVGHWTPFEDPAAVNHELGKFFGLPDGRCF